MKPAEILLFAALAAIPILIAGGVLMLRQEWSRRDRAEEAKTAAKKRAISAGRPMATVTQDIPRAPSVMGRPVVDVRHPRQPVRPDERWAQGGQIVAQINPKDPTTWGPARALGPVWHVEPAEGAQPGPDPVNALTARLRSAEAEIQRLRLENARLRSELSLCPPPSEVARVVRDHGPIGSVDIARRLGTTTDQVDREARQLTLPRAGNLPQISTLWPELTDGIDPDALRFPDPTDGPLWVWTAHIDDLGMADVVDLGVTDWDLLEQMVADLAPAEIGAGR